MADSLLPVDPLLPIDPLRLRHGRGEALLGRDFVDQSDQDDQLRWWHNRALHRAYGIVTGLKVDIAEGVAAVAPGLAYDCHGRELVLARAREVPVPDGSETWYLVLARSYAATGGVTLCWLPPEAAVRGDGVRLTVNGVDAPQVRPLARPRIGRGATIPRATAWQPWVDTVRGEERPLGIQVVVDTSAAGFTAPPCYFAQVNGSTWDSRIPLLLLVPFDHIAEPTRERFIFRLLLPWLYLLPVLESFKAPAKVPGEGEAPGGEPATARASRLDHLEAFRRLAQITDLAVTWIGIQHRSEGQT